MALNKMHTIRNLHFPQSIIKGMAQIPLFPLTVIEAPMGYGKSTAVKDCLNHKLNLVCWQRIYDSNISTFWFEFCNKIGLINHECGLKLEFIGFPEDSIQRQEAVRVLYELKLEKELVIVFDDFHLVANETVNQWIEYIIENEIPKLHIVLVARYVNLSRMEELRLKQYILHLTKEVFEFSLNDIRAYYRVSGISLKDQELQKLYELSEGWISAIYLLLLKYQETGTVESVKDIYKLVETTVYQHFSNEIKELLQSLCFFDRFTLEQAIVVSGNNNAETYLGEIINKNAFVKYDEQSQTYQMHNIFTKYLKAQFDVKGQEEKIINYYNVAAYYESTENYIEAMFYYSQAEDYSNLLHVLELDRGHSMLYPQISILKTYFMKCPWPVRVMYPIATLVYAVCLFGVNDIEGFQTACEEYGRILSEIQNRNEVEMAQLVGELEMVLMFTKYNSIPEMYNHIKKANQFMSSEASCIDTRTSWTFGSPSVLYMFYRESGLLDFYVRELKSAIGIYNELTGYHAAGADVLMKAEAYFFRGDFVNAEIVIYDALYQARKYNHGGIIMCAMFLQKRIAIFKGDYALARNTLIKMQEEVNLHQWHSLHQTIQLCDAFIYANLGQVKKINTWIADVDIDSNKLYFPIKPFFNYICSRILLVNGEYLKLIGSSYQFLEEAMVFPNTLSLIYTRIHVGAANDRIFRRQDAKESLLIALDLAMPDQLYIPFVENYDYIGALLDDIYLDRKHSEGIKNIRRLAVEYVKSIEFIKQEYFNQPKVILTEREEEIAKLASQGLTNSQIGNQLFISENTVKTALKSIFGKLSINNRAFLKQYFEEVSEII